MRTGNPALTSNAFQQVYGQAYGDQAMTINGTVNKTFLLFIIVIAGAGLTWAPGSATNGSLILLGVVGSLIMAMVTIFKKEWAMYTAPAYAFLEGIALGGISSIFEARFPGIVMQAVVLTFGTLGALLLAYKSGKIKVTDNFRLGVVAATGGIALAYFISFILSFFGVNMSIIFGGGLIGIGFSLFVIVIAALNLVLDFDFIETASENNAPKYMEWYASFGLMVTLVWLYIEFLRLLAKTRD